MSVSGGAGLFYTKLMKLVRNNTIAKRVFAIIRYLNLLDLVSPRLFKSII